MKSSIKIISLMIASLLIISFSMILAACNVNKTDGNDPENDPVEEGTTDFVYSDYTPDTLSDEIKSEIQSAFFEQTYEEENADYYNSPNQVRLEHYGSFDNAHCVILHCPAFDAIDVMTEEKVGGYTFIFGSSNTMSVYYEGEFYGLNQAYENGILDDNELYDLYSYYAQNRLGK